MRQFIEEIFVVGDAALAAYEFTQHHYVWAAVFIALAITYIIRLVRGDY